MTAAPQYRLFGGYRLLLACLVLVMHGAGPMLPDPGFLRGLSLGNGAVFVFFILSGFVITEALESFYRGQPGRFFVNRLLRILPAYWLALGITIALWLAVGHPQLDRLTPANLVGNILLFGGDLRISNFYAISIVWSLIVEMEFYIAAAAIYWLIARTGRHGAWLGLAAAVGLLGHILVVATGAHFRFFGPLFYAPFFILGAGLYHLEQARLPRGATLPVTVAAGGLALWAYADYIMRGSVDFAASLVVILALFALMLVLARLRVPAAHRWDGRLGDITYLVYLLHIGIGDFIRIQGTGTAEQPFATTGAGVAGICAMLVATIVLAALLQAVVLRPLARWRDRLRGTALYR